MSTYSQNLSEDHRTEHSLKAPTARRRSRASLACINCRARKVKCDIQTSVEATCTACRVSKTRCIFNANDDRRKSGSREYMSAIQQRLVTIESMMRQTLKDEVTSPESSHSTGRVSNARNSSVTDQRLSSMGDGQFFPSIPSSETTRTHYTAIDANPINEFQASSSNVDNGIQDGRGNFGVLPTPQTNKQFQIHDVTPPTQDNPSRIWDATTSSGPSLPEEEPAKSWEADLKDGSLRFYGPATRSHSQLAVTDLWSSENDDDFDLNPVVNLDSSQLQNMLFSAFWSWNSLTLAVTIVDEALFTMHRARGVPSQYYSKFLEDIILASSSRMSSSPSIRKIGQKYANRAKTSVLHQLESPTIAAVQGFLLLCDFESTSGTERIGWTYSGIASRLAFDLGLHQDCSELVKQGKLTPEEGKVRQLLFFAAFQNDSLWSLYFGRPSTISIPFVDTASYVFDWTKYDNTAGSTLKAWIEHCTLVHEIGSLLNDPRPLDRNRIEHLSRLYAATLSAFDSLPPTIRCRDLQISELDASAYALNMQYCGLQIILQRIPALLLSRQKTADLHGRSNSQNTLPGFTKEESHIIKYENAIRISQLLHSFLQIYGVEKLHSTMLDNMFVAASTISRHILAAQGRGMPSSKDVRWLRMLSNAMLAAQPHFPITLRMIHSISSTLKNTNLSGFFTSHMRSNMRSSKPLMPEPSISNVEHNNLLDDIFMNDILLEPPIGLDLDNDPDFFNISWPQQ